jgi:phosphate transport system protein
MDTQGDDFRHHFSSQFNQELENLRGRVMAMGSAVEQQIGAAVNALESRNETLARTVVGGDLQVNALEIYVDEECGRILARRQPAAGDLRLIVAIIKTVTDIERIGDQAKGVARMAIKMNEVAPDSRRPSLQRLGELVGDMVHRAVGAFAQMDVDLALAVERADIAADEEYESIMRRLTNLMIDDPQTVSWALHLVWAARALERAGDHAKNIAEYLIFIVQGTDVRHISIEDRERQVQSRLPRPGSEPDPQ